MTGAKAGKDFPEVDVKAHACVCSCIRAGWRRKYSNRRLSMSTDLYAVSGTSPTEVKQTDCPAKTLLNELFLASFDTRRLILLVIRIDRYLRFNWLGTSECRHGNVRRSGRRAA